MDPKEIVERIMTQHWDMAACHCWICDDGRKAGCAPQSEYLPDGTRDRVMLESVAKRIYGQHRR